MSKQPSPRADALRAMREAAYVKGQAATKAWNAAKAKAKPKPQPEPKPAKA